MEEFEIDDDLHPIDDWPFGPVNGRCCERDCDCSEFRRRLSPPVEHKVTLETDDSFWSLCCDCGWSEQHTSMDPFEPARLAREHLAEHGEDR